MPTTRRPRKGSLQYWPRKRARRAFARVRTRLQGEVRFLGFAGYKAGMTHCIVVDNRATSRTKGEDISMPATIIECPPLKVFSIRFYKKTPSGLLLANEIFSKNPNKELERVIRLPKKEPKFNLDSVKLESYDDIRVVVHTQPRLIGFKKRPELFEMWIGGSLQEKFPYAKENLGKEIKVNDVLKEGQQIDVHAITKGKGFQGPVKRFGISLKSHKSEKSRRQPGSLGPWRGQGQIMWRVAHAGQHGYHTRTEHNKWLLKIGEKATEINPKGGFLRYGNVKNPYILLKGSVAGISKRLIRITPAIRKNKRVPEEPPTIAYISTKSKQ